MIIQTWGEFLVASFQNLSLQILSVLPNLLISLIIFIVGWVVAMVVGGWVAQLLKAVRLDAALNSIGVGELINKAGYRLNSGVFLGRFVQAFIVIIFLITALDVLHLTQINLFLYEVVLNYIPNVIVAILMLLLAAVIADFLQKLVVASAKAADVVYAELLGGLTRWAVWIFAILAALNQLNIAAVFAQTLFTGLVAMLAIAGGLAFGLGGQQAAARYIEKLREDISSK